MGSVVKPYITVVYHCVVMAMLCCGRVHLHSRGVLYIFVLYGVTSVLFRSVPLKSTEHHLQYKVTSEGLAKF